MKNRRPNDLDEYLAEVEDGLFCVSAEDRECLLRDLKAHVSELTTDPDEAKRFSGRYGITRGQLLDEVGRPHDAALEYVTTVPIVPGVSMLAFIYFLVAMFVTIALVGIEKIVMANHYPAMSQGAVYLSGTVNLLGGGLLIFLTLRVKRDIVKNHLLLPYLIVFLVLISIPISLDILKFMLHFGVINATEITSSYFTSLIIVDLFVIAMLGLYVTMNHLQVIESTRAVRDR